MVEDSVLVALINESVTAHHRSRRIAARILVEALRSNGDTNGAHLKAEVIGPEHVAGVADELTSLIDLHGLRIDT